MSIKASSLFRLLSVFILLTLLVSVLGITPAVADTRADKIKYKIDSNARTSPGTASALELGVANMDRDQCLGAASETASHAQTGRIRFAGTDPNKPIRQPIASLRSATPENAARGYLSKCGSFFGVNDQAAELKVKREHQTNGGRSVVRFQQAYQDIPVFGGELVMQLTQTNDIIFVNGEILPDINLDVQPKVDAAAAQRTALQLVAEKYAVNPNDLQASEATLWIYNPVLLQSKAGETSLVWRIEVTPAELAPIRELVLMDANTGDAVLNFNQVDTALNRQTYTANNTSSQPGALVCNESNPTCAGGDADAVNAHTYGGDTYDFYFNNYSRDSINNAGMALISTVHYSWGYCNAFWNGSQMTYGDGCSIVADDVVAHEMTHGVTEYESNLIYSGQSGAINESFSDMWGEFVDLTNGKGNDDSNVRWLMGEDTSIGAIRNMKNPPALGDPDRMTNYITGGDVHTNSGIGNKAAYLITDGDTFNGYTVSGIGIAKAAAVYYEAQTNILTPSSDYYDLYNALYQACNNLIGESGITVDDCTQVRNATLATEMNLPLATTNAASTITATGATLNGTVNANGDSADVVFEYGLTVAYGATVTADQSPVTGSTNTAVNKAVTGLTPNTIYHYRVVASLNTGTAYGADKTFTTASLVTTNAASAITATGATLNGTANANGGSADVAFEYGPTTAYGTTVTADQSPVTGSTNTAVNKAVTGLTPNTIYHYRVVASLNTGTAYGADKTFTTASLVTTTNAASAITAIGATLNGTVNANGGSADVTFEYGLTVAYGTTVTADQSPVTGSTNTAVSKAVTGLTPNTIYHYRVVVSVNTGTAYGADKTFTTASLTYTITGNAGVAGATINYTDGSTTTDGNGDYSITVSYGWSGAVTPSKAGYVFSPTSKSYSNVTSNQTNQNCDTSTYLVTNTNDSGVGSLRQAIASSVSGGVINFDPSLSGQTILLASSLIINKNITIDGAGLISRIAVSGNESVRILSIGSKNTVTIKNIILRNGKRTGTNYAEYGSAIFANSYAILTVQNVTFSDNTAYTAGAIHISSHADVTILDSEFTNNTAQDEASAIYVNSSGKLTLKNSKLLNNTAISDGTIYFSGSTNSTIENNLFANNSALSGGAIYTQLGNATLNIKKNLFYNNFASSASGGGGALYFWITQIPTSITIENNTFYQNTAANVGGAIRFLTPGGSVLLNNNTLSNNTANRAGGNGGGNIYLVGNIGQMYNNIIANNGGGHDCVLPGSGSTIGDHNLVEDGSAICKPFITGDPNLGSLADNGGFTQT